jgi:membrane-associated phospholipid phosphatase
MSVLVGFVFFAAIGLVSLADGLVGRRRRPPEARWRRTAGTAVALILVGAALQLAESEAWARVALDWLPGVYLLAGYWLPAQLRTRSGGRLEKLLIATDRRFFDWGFRRLIERAPRLLLEYLEASYLCCYLTVPAALAWPYFSGHREAADPFWTAVLLSALPCYALVACCRTRPPREVEVPPIGSRRPLLVRGWNVAILDRASIGLNTFPSGHAAASFAAALSVGAVMPGVGAVLGALAISISVASVAGRYHYALDAACGALLAVAGFAVSRLV